MSVLILSGSVWIGGYV